MELYLERAGTNIDKRYFYHPSFSCISLDGFERKSVSPVESPVSVVGKSPCGQVDYLKELDPNSKTESA